MLPYIAYMDPMGYDCFKCTSQRDLLVQIPFCLVSEDGSRQVRCIKPVVVWTAQESMILGISRRFPAGDFLVHQANQVVLRTCWEKKLAHPLVVMETKTLPWAENSLGTQGMECIPHFWTKPGKWIGNFHVNPGWLDEMTLGGVPPSFS